MPAEKALAPTKHILTHKSEDIFRISNISQFCDFHHKRLKLVILVSDLWPVLSLRNPEFPHQFAMGWNHTIERSADNAPSFTAAGVEAYATAILDTVSNEMVEKLIVRSEDLFRNPAREWTRIEAFTGVDLSYVGDTFRDFGQPAALLGQTQSEVFSAIDDADLAQILRSFRLSPPLNDFIHRFGYGKPELSAERMTAIASIASDDTPGTVVGFFSQGSIYEQEARRLESSVRKLGLPIQLMATPDGGSWLANVRAKPSILSEFRRRIDGPLLYVDVDAVFHTNPWALLRGYHQDAAFCVMRDGKARSGTVLINDSEGARKFLADWQNRLDMHPDDWDQFPLNGMLVESSLQAVPPYTIGLLPVSLCYVFDRDRAALCTPPAVPIIEHLQASREREDRLGNEAGLARLERRRIRIAELGGEKTG